MRIDLMSGGRRPWLIRLLFKVVERKLGVVPGPVQVMTYRPRMLPRPLRRYLSRGMSGVGPWSGSEAELFAAFISNLNTCHF